MLSIGVEHPDCDYSPLTPRPCQINTPPCAQTVSPSLFRPRDRFVSFVLINVCFCSITITAERTADWVGLPWLPWRVFWIPTLMTNCND